MTYGPAAVDPVDERRKAGARLRMETRGGKSRLADLAEWGGYRLKFPAAIDRPEAVLINTGGGMAGGDELDLKIELGAGAALTFTTSSAERVYRTLGPLTQVAVDLTVGAAADLAFIPQETILFSRARLTRAITAEVADDGRLLMAETLVFGRAASGERITAGALHDRWRVRRGGRLIYADDVLLEGAMSGALQRPAIGAGAGATGCVLYVAPDAADRLEETRMLINSAACRVAVSTWNGLLCIRALGEPAAVRRILATVITGLLRRPLPRVWLGF